MKRDTTMQHLVNIVIASCMLAATTMTMAESDLSRHANILSEKLTSVKKGEVLKGNGTEVYISLGQKHGVASGNRFQIIRRGSPLKIGEKIVGYEESKIALTKIDRVREEMSIGKILAKIETPNAGDMAYELRKPINRMVIAQFNDNQRFNMLTKTLQEKLITSAINRGVSVVERDQLEKVLAEQQLGYSGLVNIDSAKKIGQLLGADAMLLGSISDLGNSISISTRIVDMESGDSIGAAETELPNTPQIVDLREIPVEANSIIIQPSASKPGSGRQSRSGKKGGDFTDDFTRGPDPAWQSVSGEWTMANGKFTVAAIQEKQPYSAYLSERNWKDMKLIVKVNPGRCPTHVSHSKYADICPRATGPRDRICFRLGDDRGRGGFDSSGWIVTTNGVEGALAGKKEVSVERDKQIEVVIEAVGNVYTAYIDGLKVSDYYDKKFSEGGIALGQHYTRLYHCDLRPVTFDSVRVTPVK